MNGNGKTAPAPWVPFTRAGCDFGAFSIANMEFESLPNDIGVVYGKSSTEFLNAQTALNLPNTPANAATRQRPNTDWLGIAIHCAQDSALCANGKPDLLPGEGGANGEPAPNQYVGFNALYGDTNVHRKSRGVGGEITTPELIQKVLFSISEFD